MGTYIIKRILRRPWISLAALLMATAFCFVLCYLIRYRNDLEEKLREVRESYEVLCVVTDSRGVRSEQLGLGPRFIEFVQDTENGLGGYIKEIRTAIALSLSSSLGSGHLIGPSSEKAYDPLNPALGGYCDYTVEDFFGSREDICLVPEDVYDSLAGQEIPAKVGVPTVGKAEMVERIYTVVGRYRGSGADLIVPPAVATKLAGSGGRARTDSLSFVLNDNTKGQEMMEKALEVFTEVDPASESSRPALTVQDRQYKATVSELEQNINRTGYLLPLSALLSLASGFLMGYLSVRGETKTYALMRTLGVSGHRLAGMALGEQLLLPAIGILSVGLALQQPLGALLYFLCYFIGCLLAVLRPALAVPTRLLRNQE